MMIEERGVGASLDINNAKIGRANTTRILSLYLESRATPGISASNTLIAKAVRFYASFNPVQKFNLSSQYFITILEPCINAKEDISL
jgi:hypothetical protein